MCVGTCKKQILKKRFRIRVFFSIFFIGEKGDVRDAGKS